MNFSQTAAIGSMVASLILSVQSPISMLSWSQQSTRRRSLGLVLLTSIIALYSPYEGGSISFLFAVASICLAHVLLINQLRQTTSIWTSSRMLPILKLASLGSALILSWLSLYSNHIFGLLALGAGLFHGVQMKREITIITNDFRYLQQKLASLEADQRGIQVNSKIKSLEIRDKLDMAG